MFGRQVKCGYLLHYKSKMSFDIIHMLCVRNIQKITLDNVSAQIFSRCMIYSFTFEFQESFYLSLALD